MTAVAAVPPPPRKTLLQWITDDDRDQPSDCRPACTPAISALHARIGGREDGPRQPLAPPPQLALPPLG